MAIEVEGPDGAIIEFPDGTPPAVMQKVMAAHYGAPKQAKPFDLRSDLIKSAGQGVRDVAAATAGMTGDMRDMIAGAVPGANEAFKSPLGQGLKQAFTGWPAGIPIPNSKTFNPAPYEPQSVAGDYTRTAASFLPAAVGPKAGLLQRAAQVIVPAAASETAGQATEGTSLEGPARLAGAIAGVPPAIAAGTVLDKAITRPIGGLFGRLGQSPNQLNMVGSGITFNSGPAGKPQTVRQSVDRSTAALFERAGGVKAAAERAAPYREQGVKPRVFQAAGEPGARRMQFLSRAPGKTQQTADDVIADEASQQPGRAGQAIDEAFGLASREDVAVQVAQNYERLSPQYDDLLKDARIAGMSIPEGKFGQVFDPILNRLTPAEKKQLLSFVESERSRFGGQDLSDGQELHLMRVKLGEMIDEAAAKGTDAFRRRQLTIAKNELTDAMERELPGYKNLNASWRGNAQAEEALGAAGESGGFASKFFNTGASAYTEKELAREFQSLPPFAQEAALASIRNRARMMISSKAVPDDAGSTRNVVGQFMKQETVERLRAVLGAKAEPLIRELKLLNKDYADYAFIKPRGGPDTAPLLMDAADAGATLSNVIKNPIHAVADAGYRAVANPMFESFRNKQGKDLLDWYTPEFEAALSAELLKRSGRRAAARSSGLFGGMSSQAESRAGR